MYSSLYKIWHDENHSEGIQKLDDQILENIRKYVQARKKLEGKSDDKVVNLLIKEELQNISFMLKDLYELRMTKLFKAIQTEKKVKIDYLTSDERKLYETTQESVRKCSDLFVSSAQGSKSENFSNFFNQYIPVRILKEMNAIVGADLKTYGPFKPEDLTILPRKNAESLIKHEYAVEISINKDFFKNFI
ncbi:MAG: hypothetical protein HWN67_10800 [Candidatus Helarchaeota archaeon]|nr:hypothetical protein [Candidatus Helarchaeota archaeon]